MMAENEVEARTKLFFSESVISGTLADSAPGLLQIHSASWLVILSNKRSGGERHN